MTHICKDCEAEYSQDDLLDLPRTEFSIHCSECEGLVVTQKEYTTLVRLRKLSK